MKVEELAADVMTRDELGEDVVDHPDYEVVIAINFGHGVDEERFPIDVIMWDHEAKQMVMVQE